MFKITLVQSHILLGMTTTPLQTLSVSLFLSQAAKDFWAYIIEYTELFRPYKHIHTVFKIYLNIYNVLFIV